MSTDFYIQGQHRNPPLNYSSANAEDVLRWLGVDPRTEDGLCGDIKGTELAAKCRRRLWPEKRNETPAVESTDVKRPGQCRIIMGSREANYHQERARELLVLAESAGERMVCWS